MSFSTGTSVLGAAASIPQLARDPSAANILGTGGALVSLINPVIGGGIALFGALPAISRLLNPRTSPQRIFRRRVRQFAGPTGADLPSRLPAQLGAMRGLRDLGIVPTQSLARNPVTGAGVTLDEARRFFGRDHGAFIASRQAQRRVFLAPGAGLVPAIFSRTRRVPT